MLRAPRSSNTQATRAPDGAATISLGNGAARICSTENGPLCRAARSVPGAPAAASVASTKPTSVK
jgi:hypothetical protein